MSTIVPSAGACTFEKPFSLPGSPQRVFDALTQPVQLERWFAERVRVEPRVGGAYRFWGRYTAWMPSQAEADQTITAFEPPSRLAFRWTWRDTRCDADLRLQASGRDGCTLRVRMAAAEPRMGFGDECIWYMSDFWRFSVGNLRAYLTTGEPALRPDFQAKGAGVDMSVFIAAPPHVVYRALTDPQQMDRWISTKAVCDRVVGNDYSYGWMIKHDGIESPCGPTMLLDVVPNRLVEHDWHHKDEPITRVRWELNEVEGGTIVRLVHKRRIVEPEFGGYVGGWASFLTELREFAGALADGTDSTWRSPRHTADGAE